MRSDSVPTTGLAIGGVLGLVNTFVASDASREMLWIDCVGIVIAGVLGNDLFAAGFITDASER